MKSYKNIAKTGIEYRSLSKRKNSSLFRKFIILFKRSFETRCEDAFVVFTDDPGALYRKCFASLFTVGGDTVTYSTQSHFREGLTRISCFVVTTSKPSRTIGRAFDCSFRVIRVLTGREI